MKPTHFRDNQLFDGLANGEGAAVDRIPVPVYYDEGEVIFDEGERADCLYLVGDGCVRISKRGRGEKQETLSYVEPGDFFGEMAMYDAHPRSARATATQRTRLGRVDRAGLEHLLRLAPAEISRNLTHRAISRLRNANEHYIRSVMQAERLSLVGSMASTIIHDFKNPMSVLLGVSGLLEGRSEDPALHRWAGMVRRSVDCMLGMTQELLDFSRGQTELNLVVTPVSDLLGDLDEQLLCRLPDQGVQVVREVEFLGATRIDRGRFCRALLNLAKNAAEAMPGGGVLTIRVERRSPAVVFTVADTGCGIPDDFLPRLFDPFATHGKSNGTGLGMAIVKSVVDAHRGTISVTSEPGVGTRFEIAIPE